MAATADAWPGAMAFFKRYLIASGSFRSPNSASEDGGSHMRVRLTFATIFLGILLAAGAALQAHHSFSATYDGNKPITLKGKVVKLGWQNPHAHIYVDVTN